MSTFLTIILLATATCLLIFYYKHKGQPKTKKNQQIKFCLWAIIGLSFLLISVTTAKSTTVKPVSVKTEYKGQAALTSARKESVRLAKEASKIESSKAESSAAISESATAASSSSEAAIKAQQAAESSKQVVSAEQSRQAEADKQAQVAAQQSAAPAPNNAAGGGNGTTINGDLATGTTGQIVGNSKSKIYHVPGQASYNMNSANAVYFNSEADAQAAGYRKSQR